MVKFYQNCDGKPLPSGPTRRRDTYSAQLSPEAKEVCIEVGRILAAVGDELNQLPKQTTDQIYSVDARTVVAANLKLKATH